MDSANTSDSSQKLDAATKTPIADLSPDIPHPATRAVRGVVTITWPYSFVKGTFSFILAEPDYRLRRNRGQIRVNLTGASAKAASESGLSSSDEVLVSLDGAEWAPEQVKKRQSLPGAGVDWQLKFSEKLLLQVTLAETGETKLITVDPHSPAEPESEPRVEIPPVESSHVEPVHVEDTSTQRLETLTPLSKTHIARLKDGEFESPAFIKRARMSYGSLFEDGYDIFEDDGGVKGRGRKRSRFGRDSSAWRYTSQSPSPEPTSPQDRESSPPRPNMADEGCQTMEIDFPTPSPIDSGTHVGANIEETQKSPNPTLVDPVTQPRQGMVDHGVQGDFHGEWPTTTPVELPTFDPGGGLSSDGSGLPAFHHTGHFHTDNGDFQQGWDYRSVELHPTSYSHATEQPLPNDFVGDHMDQRPDRLGAIRSESRTRSPSEPSNLAIDPAEQNLNNIMPTDEHNYSIQPLPQSTDYPPLDLENEGPTGSSLGGAHLDYPPSYLDDNRSFSQEAMPIATTTFSPRISAAVDPGSSLWTSINEPHQAATISSADRLGSAEGESIDNAVVIDESDSDEDPPPSTTAEDAVMKDHTDDPDMDEEAEFEDEVDAEYSEDDEPEYEGDEMGGDYDTRNYTAPDDDEDDSHDEDLRPHHLEPEFDDGRSWEGEGDDDDLEDEDAENPDYESEYDMDDDGAELRPSPQPISQPNPQVIDLISSSEDEGEDDEENQPPSISNHNNNARSLILSETMPLNELVQTIKHDTQSESEEDEDEEDEDEAEADDESDVEENNQVKDDISAHSSDEAESESLPDEENNMQEYPDDHQIAMAEVSENEDAAISLNMEAEKNLAMLESSQNNDLPSEQASSPQPSKADITSIRDKDDSNTKAVEAEAGLVAPQSAADGLEILSQVVESESKANNQTMELNVSDDLVIASASSDANGSLMDHMQGALKQDEREPQNTQQDEEPVDLASTSPNGVSDSQPMEVDEDRPAEVVVSPSPLTRSFTSQPTVAKMADVLAQENVASTEPQILAIQLPTPRDTQVTGNATVSDPSADVSVEIDMFSKVSDVAEPIEITTQEHSFSAERPYNAIEPSAVAEDAPGHAEERHTESTSVLRQQTPLEANAENIPFDHTRVSLGLSFQSQEDSVNEIAQTSFSESIPKITIGPEGGNEAHSDVEVDANDASVSFISQMDEELQASILEYSQDFEEATHMNTPDEYEIGDGSENYDDETSIAEHEDEETHIGTESRHASPRGPSPELGADTQERQVTQQIISTEEVDTPEQVDPSVQLARATNASKRQSKQHEITKNNYANGKRLPPVDDATAPVEDPSVQLARASFNKAEESNSMTAAKLKLVRHLRDELPDCTSLKVIRQHIHKKLSIIAMAMMQPPDPQRAKGGPREFMMSFTITDYSIGPHSVIEVQLYRPHKETLPIVKAGDAVLLRNFTVVSLHNKGYGLRTNDESSWAVFDQEGEPPQIKGPPVEYSAKETDYVAHLRVWFNLLDEKAKEKLERANKKIIDAGRSK
ncbi:hypothetical protein F5B19DRAFT_434392 [Rostrohypoxylon terebratum]|nr:hypothetical protein F5B19DRAFT_434392 [Rostrohypoxylon terebratum]